MKRIRFFCFFLLLLAACKKDHGEAADAEAPVIKMTSPSANQAFTAGQNLVVNGRITDNTRIEEVHLELTNKTTGVLLTHEHFVPDSAGYTLARTFMLSPAATYKIKVEAEDTKGNSSEVEITVSAN